MEYYHNYMIVLNLHSPSGTIKFQRDVHSPRVLVRGDLLRVCDVTYVVDAVTLDFDDHDYPSNLFVEASNTHDIKHGFGDLIEMYKYNEWKITETDHEISTMSEL